MQPNLGVKLRQFLFEPYSEDMVFNIQNVMTESLMYWLPFITINDIKIKMSDNQSGDFINLLEVSVIFSWRINNGIW